MGFTLLDGSGNPVIGAADGASISWDIGRRSWASGNRRFTLLDGSGNPIIGEADGASISWDIGRQSWVSGNRHFTLIDGSKNAIRGVSSLDTLRWDLGRQQWVVGAPASQLDALSAAILAATTSPNIWLVNGDAGVNQSTAPGRVSSLTSQGGPNNWTTLGPTQEPAYVALDSSLNNKGTWATNGSSRYMLNAYNPPAPLTQPHYRISVLKSNRTLFGRAQNVISHA